MTKLLDCPYCEVRQKPVIDSAEVCSPKCRQRKKRIKDKEVFCKVTKKDKPSNKIK